MTIYSNERCPFNLHDMLLNRDKRLILQQSSFGGLEVASWLLVPKFAGSHPAKAVGFLGQKNPRHAFLQRASKATGPMSWLYGM